MAFDQKFQDSKPPLKVVINTNSYYYNIYDDSLAILRAVVLNQNAYSAILWVAVLNYYRPMTVQG